MAQFVLPVVGAAIGFAVGGPAGAQLGFAAGSVGNAVLGIGGQDSQGPRLDDLRAPKVAYGTVIPYVEGHPRLPAIIAWQSDKREIENTQGGGKGGPEQTTFTYVADFLIVLAENDIGDLRRVWSNGELVWINTELVADALPTDEPPWGDIQWYRGAADQMPNGTYEAAIGVGFAPAYRDRQTVVITDLDLGSSGQLPVLTFECNGNGTGGGDIGDYLYFYPFAADPFDLINPDTNTADSNTGPGYSGAFDKITFDGYANIFLDVPFVPSQTGQYIRGVTPVTSPATIDYSEQTVYEFELTAPRFISGSGGAQSYEICRFFTNLGEGSVTGFTIEVFWNGSVWELSYRVLIGSTVVPSVGLDIFLSNGDSRRFLFRAVVSANPDDIEVPNPTEGTKLYLSIGAVTQFELIASFTGSEATRNFNLFSLGSTQMRADDENGQKAFFGISGRRFVAYRGATRSPDSQPFEEPTLQEVVENQCARAGIPAEYVDATDLATRNVRGMPLTQLISPRNVIDTLSKAYFFSAVESDKIKFNFLGGDEVADVPYNDLGASNAEPEFDALPIVYTNDIERPVQVFVRYINNNDDYQEGVEESFRLTNSPGNTASQEFAIVFTPTEAKQIADITVRLAKVSSVRFGPIALSRDWVMLEPTDPITINDRDGNSYRVRLTSKNEVDGVLTFEALQDDPDAVISAAVTSGGYTNTINAQQRLATEFEILDIPLLRDVDDITGIYWAAGGASGWPGATWNQSIDDSTFTRVADTERNSIIGVATTTLGNFTGGRFFDEIDVVRVNVGTRQLSSYSRDQVLNGGAGAYIVGSEVIQARNATLVSEGVYDLSGLMRGMRGTEWAISGHGSNERVVLLDLTTTNRQALNVSDIMATIYWKAITFGRAADTATSESIQFNAVSQKPFAPVDLRGNRDTSDLVITWERRTRLTTNFYTEAYPLGEATEAYIVSIYADSGFTSLVAEYTATTNIFTYTAAMQGSPQPATVYVKVCQVSAIAGRGYTVQGEL